MDQRERTGEIQAHPEDIEISDFVAVSEERKSDKAARQLLRADANGNTKGTAA
jgi:hypothetical protein